MVAVGVLPAVIFLWKGVIDMMIVQIVAGIMLVFCVDVLIGLFLFDKAIKRNEKIHEERMKEIKEKKQV